MSKITRLFYCLILLLTTSSMAEACSALVFNGEKSVLTAVNLDWYNRTGVVVIHPRNDAQTSIAYDQDHPALQWKSRYGSVIFHGGTIDKVGPAADGMNEMGLSVSMLVLKSAKYAPLNAGAALDTGHWVLYMLSHFKNVQEVVEHAPTLQLFAGSFQKRPLKVHFLVHDAQGKLAILEYLKGKLSIYQGTQLHALVLTNSPYLTSSNRLMRYIDFGGTQPLPGGYDTYARFVRASAYLKRLTSISQDDAIAYAFNGLADVAQPPGTDMATQFSMVFDLTNKVSYFRSINHPNIRTISLANIPWNDLHKPIILNVFEHVANNVVHRFTPLLAL